MEVIEGGKEKSQTRIIIKKKRERERAIRIRGAAIEPRRLFHRELIIVLSDEKRRPYYSPVHNKNS